MSDPWYRLRSGPGQPAHNMAVDQALLEGAATLGLPVLRLYSWDRPAASFGYSQRIADVEALTPLRPLVRRTTGGGIVPHDADWTYSVVIPPTHFWYALSAVDSYERMHAWLRSAFQRIGFEAVLAPCCDPAGPGQCFVGAEKYDLLFLGRKIAGAAQRRNRLGLLIQGSIHPPEGAGRTVFEEALLESASAEYGVAWSDHPDVQGLNVRARALSEAVYSDPDHTRRR